jgi:hypothetical protein
VEIAETIGLWAVATGAGTLGTMLGLGGGIFLVPIFTLGFDIPLRDAIAASAISVVANSVSGSRVYLKLRFTNVRLGFLLLTSMTAGALVGGLVAVSLPQDILKAIFGTMLLSIAVIMYWRRIPASQLRPTRELPPDPYYLAGRFQDGFLGDVVRYVPQRLTIGVPVSSLAGVASGLFGIGGGPISVPLMNLVMKVPVKAAASTSSFMVGLTASTSAFIYYSAGSVDASVVLPAMFGIIVGARFGARLTSRIRAELLATIFIAVLVLLAASMYVDAALAAL